MMRAIHYVGLLGLLVISSLTWRSGAFWRLPCHGRVGVARIDPIVSNGHPSEHAHAIHGGNSFCFTSNSSSLLKSDCTSCAVKQDKSAYWAPPLYFVSEDGEATMVDQVGGMLAYYLLYGQNITAFPSGFQMIAGDNRRRNITLPVPDPQKSEWYKYPEQNTQYGLSQKAIGFNCMNYAIAPESSLYRHFLPDKAYLDENCLDGIRFELMFPSCWNGKDLDSPDHKSHMAYPSLVMDGVCPEGFDTRVPSLFYETIWNTAKFKGLTGQFIIGNGDPTGYGYHGDFVEAWEPGFLQKAVNLCTNLSGKVEDCPIFDLQDDEAMNSCALPMPAEIQHEDCTEPGKGLPGNVPVQYGPGYASVLDPDAPAQTVLLKPTVSASVPVLSYKSATAMVTDQFGGGIFADVSQASSAVATSAVATSAVTTSSLVSLVTAAPSLDNKITPAGVDGAVVGTKYITDGGRVYAIVVVQEEQTVVVNAMPTAVVKRHAHPHHGRRYTAHRPNFNG